MPPRRQSRRGRCPQKNSIASTHSPGSISTSPSVHVSDYDQLRPVLCFSLIWNLFETVACRRMATIRSIREVVDHADQAVRLDRTRYTEFLNYFRDRYLHAGDIEEVFERLLMTDMESQVAVRRALVAEAQDLNNIVFQPLLIAHRIRNNLFHGNKGVETLHTQTKLFQVINRLLATFIEDITAERVALPSGLRVECHSRATRRDLSR